MSCILLMKFKSLSRDKSYLLILLELPDVNLLQHQSCYSCITSFVFLEFFPFPKENQFCPLFLNFDFLAHIWSKVLFSFHRLRMFSMLYYLKWKLLDSNMLLFFFIIEFLSHHVIFLSLLLTHSMCNCYPGEWWIYENFRDSEQEAEVCWSGSFG